MQKLTGSLQMTRHGLNLKGFIRQFQINTTLDEFEKVLNDIRIRQDFEELSAIYNLQPDLGTKYYAEKARYFRRINEDVNHLIEVITKANSLIFQIESISSVKINSFDKKLVCRLLNDLNYNHLQYELNIRKEKKEKCIEHLVGDYMHPIALSLMKSLSESNIENYENQIQEIGNLLSVKEEYGKYKKMQENLIKFFPNIIDSILHGDIDFAKIQNIESTIYFKHAQDYVDKVMKEGRESKLLNDYDELEKREVELISTIASEKAWMHVIDKLNDDTSLQSHLVAWRLAIRSIPKTRTSSNYQHFRRVANNEMKYCKQSIPCWIMPLLNVAENFTPEPGMFDYVIVDEASQLGPDAVFLAFLGKKIIVVGDDKQTAPEYFIQGNIVNGLINKWLKQPEYEIPYSDFYGTQNSFFDHFDRLCAGKRVVLKEHFRCMPEIIEFSNKNFYEPQNYPLYPLRQYSHDRLEPLRAVPCQEGYVEGSGQRIRNEVEAKKIAEEIAKICKDERYYKEVDGKKMPMSIGIISLQGNVQAQVIENKLMDKIGSDEIKRRNIICGNSASFQGDERDIIFLSMVVAEKYRFKPVTTAKDERRYNVAVSRAKEQIWLFHSLDLTSLQAKSQGVVDLRYRLLDHFLNYKENRIVSSDIIPRKPGNQPPPFESWFEVDVHNDIIRKGYSVISQYPVVKGRHRIDLAVILKNGVKIAVECDGDIWHGPEQAWADAGRERFLKRIGGWQIFRVRGSDYYFNRVKAMEPLWKLIELNEIRMQPRITKDNDLNKKTIDSKLKQEEAIEQVIKEKPNGNDENDTEWKTPTYSSNNVSQEGAKETILDSHFENSEQKDLFANNPDLILRYFNLFKNGTYILTTENPLKADYVLPIQTSQKNGYLLQCYESGHINKVYVSTLLSRKIGKEYMNGLNQNDNLVFLTIIENEMIVGIYFYENGIKKFKAHLTENISCREQLHLQGYKVIYNEFDRVAYKFFPLRIQNEINRLIYQSFTANGKPVNHEYYSNEWRILQSYLRTSIPEVRFSKPKLIVEQSNNPPQNSTTNFQFMSLNELIKHYFEIIETRNETVLNIIDHLPPQTNQFFPIFGFSAVSKTIRIADKLKKQQKEKLFKAVSSFESKKEFYNHNTIQEILDDLRIAQSYVTDHITWNILRKNIPVEEIKSFLKSYDEKDSTAYRKMLCAYDFKKYKDEIILEKATVSTQKVKLNSTVKLNYLDNNKELIVQLVENPKIGVDKENGIQKIGVISPLGLLIYGKSIGDRVELKNTNSLIEIMEIIN
jgi:hypothetical protein